jgi:hypothetical protein
MIIVSLVLFITVVALSFLVWNLLAKVEKYEDDITLKDEFLNKFKSMVEKTAEGVRKVDEKGLFESEDETGFIFKDLRDLMMALNSYFQNYVTDLPETKEEEKK